MEDRCGAITAVRNIHEHFGIPLGAEAENAMKNFLADKPKDKQGTHHYSLEGTGLMQAEVHQRFKDYVDDHLLQSA